MYNPKCWKCGINITARVFCDYLKKDIPEDAIVHVCGESEIFFHLSTDGTIFSIDYDSIMELLEYDGCNPMKIE